jgi:hypothetical protein
MAVRLWIRSIDSPDVEFDVWKPTLREQVHFPVQMEIGEVGTEGADLFSLTVATPEGLRRYAKTDVISERGLLVLSEFSWEMVHRALDRILEVSAAESWNESVLRLQRYFRWEYEDYVES